MYDPFRLQFLTISLDSEVVLAVIGVLVAGLVARARARRFGRGPSEAWEATLDVAFWTLAGARLGWVAWHLSYYIGAPVQIAAIGDGGFLFSAGEVAGLYALGRWRTRLGYTWQELGTLAAPATAAALLLDRAGCSLTACGAGQPTQTAWALVRSGSHLHPVGLYGMAIWLAVLWILWRYSTPGKAWLIMTTGLVVERGLAWQFGFESGDGLLFSILLLIVLGALPRLHRPLQIGTQKLRAGRGEAVGARLVSDADCLEGIDVRRDHGHVGSATVGGPEDHTAAHMLVLPHEPHLPAPTRIEGR